MTSVLSNRPARFALSALLALSVFGLVLAGAARAATETFLPTGKEQTYTVPAGVTSVHVVAIGGKGGTVFNSGAGGFGAMASADLAVAPGQVLFVEVGGNGSGAAGGFNGGGNGGDGGNDGGGGGGASDVRTASRVAGTSLALRLIVAAGGGGGGGSLPGPPNVNGGGTAGAVPTAGGDSYGTGGQPGTATAGGSAGTGCKSGTDGVLGSGGVGGDATCGPGNGGGGGGGGVFGGGGGASTSAGTGGGAGASGFGAGASNATIATDVTGAPSISITANPALPAPPVQPQPQPQPTLAAPPAPAKCVVPRLNGRKLRGARKALVASHCKLGLVSGRKRGGPVIGQRPKAGKELPAGTEVSVTLGSARS